MEAKAENTSDEEEAKQSQATFSTSSSLVSQNLGRAFRFILVERL